MELRPGFKQTELGAFPSDWECRELGSLDPFVTSGSRGWAEFYADFGSAFIRITNMSRESIYLDLNDLKCVALPPQSSEGTRTSLHPGDLLVSITADIGIVSFIDGSVPIPAYINQHIALVRFVDHQVDRKYLAYFLAAEASQRAFRAATDQGAKAGMNLDEVRKIRAVLPPANEQRAIAAALSDVDALLAKLDQLVEKKRDLKQAAMQQLLTGQSRLPGFSQEWGRGRLGDVASLSPGINKPVSEMGSGALYVTVQDLYKGTSIPVEELGRIKVSAAEIQTSALRAGDIVFGKSSVKREGIGYPSIFLGAPEPAVCTGFAYRARANPEFADARYLFYALRWDSTRRWIIDNSQASALTNINKKIADSIPVPLPGVDEQKAIAAILSDIDAEVASLEARRDKTRALRQGMTQELLTGRIRLV